VPPPRSVAAWVQMVPNAAETANFAVWWIGRWEAGVRILEVITGGEPGGAQRHVATLTRGLRAAGHEVIVAHGGGSWLAEQVGATCRVPSLGRSIRPDRDWAAERALEHLMRTALPDVVHAHSSKAGILARVAAGRVGVPAVYTAHGFVFQDPMRPAVERWLYRRLEQYFGRRCRAVIAVSARDAAWARGAGLRQVVHIPNGVEVPSAPKRMPPGPPWRVGFLGRFTPEKGFAQLVAAVAAAGPRWELVVAGDGPLARAYHAAVREAGVSATFLGWQTSATPLLAQVHVLAVPSWKEGLPYSLLDGLAHGLPVVVTDVGGMADVVRPLDDQLVVPAGSPRSITMALTHAVGLGETFYTAARCHVRQHYDVERMVAATAQTLEEASRARSA